MAEKLWVEQYINELDKDDRLGILEKAIEEEGLTGENALRKQFLELRYEKNAKSGLDIDHFIRGWMGLAYLRNEKSNGVFARKRIEKEKERIRQDFRTDLEQANGEIGTEVIYGEFYNVAKLYMHLCMEDRTYGAVLLGLGRMKPSKLLMKIALDFFLVGYELPEALGMEEELQTFRRAITDAFCDEHRKEKHMLLDLIGAGNK